MAENWPHLETVTSKFPLKGKRSEMEGKRRKLEMNEQARLVSSGCTNSAIGQEEANNAKCDNTQASIFYNTPNAMLQWLSSDKRF